jgi:spore coat protein U-like protein
MWKSTYSICTGVLLSLTTINYAEASTTTGSIPVSLTITASCTVQSAANIAFGSQTAITSNLDTSSSIGVVCTNATPYTLGLSAGIGTGATVASRVLTSGSATIPYTIYQDSGRTQVWGVTPTVDTESATGTGAVQTYTAYGRVAPVSAPVAGVYADTVAVTVAY